MNGYIGVFSKSMESMLAYREALGYSRMTHSANLLNFDRYCVAQNLERPILSEGLVWGWLNELTAQKRSGMNDKATTIRLFGKYLTSIGQEAYVLPDRMFVTKKPDNPYIFTDDELSVLFAAIDSLSTEKPHDLMATAASTNLTFALCIEKTFVYYFSYSRIMFNIVMYRSFWSSFMVVSQCL